MQLASRLGEAPIKKEGRTCEKQVGWFTTLFLEGISRIMSKNFECVFHSLVFVEVGNLIQPESQLLQLIPGIVSGW